MPKIDTFNKFAVALQADQIRIMRLPPQHISATDAMLLAAYLVMMAKIVDPKLEFQQFLTAVEGT